MRLISILSLVSLITNCSQPEPSQLNYIVNISNESNSSLEVRGFFESTLIWENGILPDNKTQECTYTQETFLVILHAVS